MLQPIKFIGIAVFQPLFAIFNESRYAHKFIMMSDLTQQEALKRSCSDLELQELIDSSENLLPDNPCKMGIWLTAIQNGNAAKEKSSLHLHVCSLSNHK